MSVRHQHLHIAEQRIYADATIRFARAPNLAPIGLRLVRSDLAFREAQKILYKFVSYIARHIHPVVRNGFQRGVIRCGEMPIELHLHAARPLNDRVHSNRILERLDHHLRARRARGRDRLRHIGN